MATIKDVARRAGVSIATVSRVLNGSSLVSEGSARRVRSAAKRLDYWPDINARALTTKRSHAIGVLLPDLFGEFFSEVIRGIDHAAREAKLQILVSSSHASMHELVGASQAMRGRIDGLIAMVPDDGSSPQIRQVIRRFPVVLLNPRQKAAGCSSVSIANYDGARAMVEHLLRLGHRRIAILRGPQGNADADERLRGYREALRAAGVAPDRRLELQGDFTENAGFTCCACLLGLEPRPTAIFAANDYMAIGLLRALRDQGVDVPGAMAVTGFDDIAFARYLEPPLTTVHVDAYALGEHATRSLLGFIHEPGPATCTHFVLPTRLVVRASCGSRHVVEPDPVRPRRKARVNPEATARPPRARTPVPALAVRARGSRGR